MTKSPLARDRCPGCSESWLGVKLNSQLCHRQPHINLNVAPSYIMKDRPLIKMLVITWDWNIKDSCLFLTEN